jgi:hypothetical protein
VFPIVGKWDNLWIVGHLIETDGRGRVVLPGRRNERFIVTENEDGSILLEPAIVVSRAQYEYDHTPELQDLLARAAESPTVRRTRASRSA